MIKAIKLQGPQGTAFEVLEGSTNVVVTPVDCDDETVHMAVIPLEDIVDCAMALMQMWNYEMQRQGRESYIAGLANAHVSDGGEQ